MNIQEYTALALARWIAGRVSTCNDFACEGLPPIDVSLLFRELAGDKRFVATATNFSIALAGFGVNPTDMELLGVKAGLIGIRAFADDLHVAAEWRNNRDRHPRTLALAAGYNAGVHTLDHYERPSPGSLARVLLEDARDGLKSRFPDSPDVHRQLLLELVGSPWLETLLSLESCADYLARWDSLRSIHGNHAPWMALPSLGLLQDRDLFGKDQLGRRLKTNLETTRRIRTLRASLLRDLAARASKYRNTERRAAVSSAVGAVEAYLQALYQGRESPLDLSDALVVVAPPKDSNKTETRPTDDEDLGDPSGEPDDNESDQGSGVRPAHPVLSRESADALLDGREDDLAAIADALDRAWETAEQEGTHRIELETTLPSCGKRIDEVLEIDPVVMGWVRDFCTEDRWGGLIETQDTDVEHALKAAADGTPLFVNPGAVIVVDGESLSLEAILDDWDRDLPGLIGAHTHLADTWRELRKLRNSLLPHLGKLVFHARHWLDGRPGVLAEVRRYLVLAAQLYRETQEHYRVMASESPDWARAALETLLVLDMVQLRVQMADGKSLAKTILLPTHPLHLWRNERLSTLLRGLSHSTELAPDERDTIRQELERPEQFLSVVRLSSLPAGRGLGQFLPYTRQVAGLPVFENLSNACSGPDGLKGLREALDQFVIHYPNHPFPLRVAAINPPAGADLTVELVRLLKDPRYRGGQRLPAISLDIYASGQHADWLGNSLRFSDTAKEDDVQEKIADGRLSLRVHEHESGPAPTLEAIVKRLRERPSHLVALFDESTIQLRQRTLGQMLPMSPFCVRYDVHLDRHSGRIELLPQRGESPFSEFLELMKELEGNQRDVTIQAYADAEGLAHTVDALLQGDQPAATWLFLADRALPSEAGMRSVRIWDRREGLRDTFLAARDFTPLARLMRQVFAKCNLTLQTPAMERLLHQGARLLGGGLLSLIKKQDGKPNERLVIGLAGLIFAARDFQRRYPGALVLGVDHRLAQLWLRTGTQRLGERCDLLVLWKDPTGDGGFELMGVEVKASNSEILNDAATRLFHALAQIGNTLEAVADGLAAAVGAPPSPLSVPRCEMLKQTLARAAQTRTNDAALDRENRRRWGGWLLELFGGDPANRPRVRLSGCIVSVLLRQSGRGSEEHLPAQGEWPMVHRTLGLPEVEDLLEDHPASSASAPEPASSEDQQPQQDALPVIARAESTFDETPVIPEAGSSNTIQSETLQSAVTHRLDNTPGRVSVTVEGMRNADQTSETWPPAVNTLGMIGQDSAVSRLVEQVVFSRATGTRFPDKLFVGPAGVGKSTLAHKIADMLGYKPVFFNGATLRRPADLIQPLDESRLLPETQTGEVVRVGRSLLFIDEVHGIARPVATVLLSAMDDRRVTTVDGCNYDFTQVIFLLATTDPGQLSEAFQSRPIKTWLRPYTLHELAGIVWLHGKECLDTAELEQDACYEIAARNRCNPRRSVRELANTLLPYFFSRAIEAQGKEPSLQETAALMTRRNIASFYDEQGVDPNGLDSLALSFLRYLKQQGTTSEPTRRQALGLAHPQDFVETAEYLVRLGLIETSTAGRRLTRQGERYLKSDLPPDLRERISRTR